MTDPSPSLKDSISQHPCDIDMRMHGTVTVGTKGQIVIPKEARDLLDIQFGDQLMVITKHGKALGMIPSKNIAEFMRYMHSEMGSQGYFENSQNHN